MNVNPPIRALAGTLVILLADIENQFIKNLNEKENPFRKGRLVFLRSNVGSFNRVAVLSTSPNENDFHAPSCIVPVKNILMFPGP